MSRKINTFFVNRQRMNVKILLNAAEMGSYTTRNSHSWRFSSVKTASPVFFLHLRRTRVLPWWCSSFLVRVLQYHRGSTGVSPWEYWSFPVGVLEFYRGSTGVLLWRNFRRTERNLSI